MNVLNWYSLQAMPVISALRPGAAFRLTIARALAELRFQRRSDPSVQSRIDKIQTWAEQRA